MGGGGDVAHQALDIIERAGAILFIKKQQNFRQIGVLK